MRYAGLVTKKPFATGSKSDHEAVFLESDQGEFVLRLRGGDALVDPSLAALVGKRMQFEGMVHGYTLIVWDWRAADQ